MTHLPHYDDDRTAVYLGDCIDVMRSLPDSSVDSIVTDPPYDLVANKRGGSGAASVNLESPYGRSRIGTGNGAGGFMGKAWDSTGIAFDPATWAECLRVLKPGGHLLAFGGTRTWHRQVVAIEDAGFEVRDSIAWLYGSGFPKSLDVSKAIDKAAGAAREVVGRDERSKGIRPGSGNYGGGAAAYEAGHDVTVAATDEAREWQGWGTALKPAFEPVVVARKPLAKGMTVAANVLAHGTGALNIDATRVHADDVTGPRKRHGGGILGAGSSHELPDSKNEQPPGRWPANVMLDESQAAALDAQTGTNMSKGHHPKARKAAGDVVYELGHAGQDDLVERHAESGGASRFFYVAKAPTSERPKTDDGLAHPTVKPLSLMRQLVRLVTPPDGVVLEPFTGSGTTVEAAILEGFRVIAIERERDYWPLIRHRIARAEGVL